jgi:hypothetical protein
MGHERDREGGAVLRTFRPVHGIGLCGGVYKWPDY